MYSPPDNNEVRNNALGFVKMPEGYDLIQLDSGHWIWVHESTDRESEIHWDKWAIYRGSVEDSKNGSV